MNVRESTYNKYNKRRAVEIVQGVSLQYIADYCVNKNVILKSYDIMYDVPYMWSLIL